MIRYLFSLLHRVQRFYRRNMGLKWKLAIVFGFLGIVGVGVSCYATYLHAYGQFNQELGDKLVSASKILEKLVDPEALSKIHSIDDPYYPAAKALMTNLQNNFNLSWLAIYRFDGEIFTHIVDGAEMGSEFIPDFPIFDMNEEMHQAWGSGTPAMSDAYIDAYGSWQSYYAPIKNASGTVVGIMDVSKSNETLDRFRKDIVGKAVKLAIVITLLALFLGLVFASYLTSSISRLTDGAKTIALGNLSHRIPNSGRHDEISILISAFNFMAGEVELSKQSLERKIFELTTLYEISQKINFASNTQEILKLILEKSVKGLKANRGSVMLFNEDLGMLAVDVAYGEGVEFTEKRIEIRPGEGVAGRVLQDLEPLILNENIEQFFKPYDNAVEMDVKSIMCIPLLLENRSIGVMNMVNKKEGIFNDADLALASTMAAQIALTLEKSRLYELSITDGLTKLFVHRYFQVALDNEIKRARRYGSPVSLILFDIDHFKKFNDTYGHQMGDRVLSISASILRDSLRGVDIPARYGGEEFVVILPETDEKSAFAVAERLRKAIEAHLYPGDEGPIRVTISLGVAAFPVHSSEKLDLIKKADEALYKSKENGRNRTTMYGH